MASSRLLRRLRHRIVASVVWIAKHAGKTREARPTDVLLVYFVYWVCLVCGGCLVGLSGPAVHDGPAGVTSICTW